MAIGFALDRVALRWAALALFALTVGKVFLLDLGFLSGLYRILACLVLALALAGTTWAYQRRPDRRPADGP